MSTTDTFLDDKKSQKQLEEELGKGVEKEPELGEKPELKIKELDLSGAYDVDGIVNQLRKLPDTADVDKQTDKYDEYQNIAKRIWVIRQAEKDSFEIPYKTERDQDGKPKKLMRTFYYSPISLKQRDDLLQKQLVRSDSSNKLTVISMKGRQLSKNKDEEESIKYLETTEFKKLSEDFFSAHKDYYKTAFMMYYGVGAEVLSEMTMEDIVDYTDVAIRKEGVRSPQ